MKKLILILTLFASITFVYAQSKEEIKIKDFLQKKNITEIEVSLIDSIYKSNEGIPIVIRAFTKKGKNIDCTGKSIIDNFFIDAKGLTINKKGQFFAFNPMLYKDHEFPFKAVFKYNTTISNQDTFTLNYKGKLVLDYSGRKGKNGEPGAYIESYNSVNGLPGKVGLTGNKGRNIEVFITSYIDEVLQKELLQIKVLNLGNNNENIFLANPLESEIKIMANGGNGGQGGRGGPGGKGTTRNVRYSGNVVSAPAATGGSGGYGGNGGKGGIGGQGGSITFNIDSLSSKYLNLFSFENRSGYGGKEGKAGARGPCGDIIVGNKQVEATAPCRFKKSIKYFENKGEHGLDGVDGQKVEIIIAGKTNKASENNEKEELEKSDSTLLPHYSEGRIYFDTAWAKTSVRNASYYRIVESSNNELFEVKDYYLNDTIQMVGKFSDVEMSIKEGLSTWYYPNGKPKSNRFYLNGVENGTYKSWYESGQLKTTGIYTNGGKEGIWNYMYESGQLKQKGKYTNGKKDSIMNWWYENRQLETKGKYTDGKKDSIWNWWHENGQLKQIGKYTNGKNDSIWNQWHENGQIIVTVEWSSGTLDGISKEWYENGQLKRTGKINYGKIDSVWNEWYENGQLNATGKYIDGKKDSVWNRWYENGKIQSVEKYVNNKPIGTWNYFYLNGIKNLECIFIDGKLDKNTVCDTLGNILAIIQYNEETGNGVFENYYPNGTLISRVILKDFLCHGYVENYYKNGNKKLCGYAEKGYKVGIWNEYYPSGDLKETIKYNKDNKEKIDFYIKPPENKNIN